VKRYCLLLAGDDNGGADQRADLRALPPAEIDLNLPGDARVQRR
jgi:hypothetical protein